MAYLTIGGVTVKVALDSVSLREVGAGGEEERSPSGTLEGGPLVQKREWAMATTPLPPSEVDAWKGLLRGDGHVFTFDSDLYSTRGRGPSASGGATLVASGAKYGGGYLAMPTGTANVAAWNLGAPSGSQTTLMGWVRESGGVWGHYIKTPANTYLNGAAYGAPEFPFWNYVNGVLQLGDVEASAVAFDYDDVVALPFVVPASWVASLYAQHSAAAWSALPRVLAAGDFASSSVTVRGKVPESRVIRCAPSGSLTNAYTIQFTLQEV